MVLVTKNIERKDIHMADENRNLPPSYYKAKEEAARKAQQKKNTRAVATKDASAAAKAGEAEQRAAGVSTEFKPRQVESVPVQQEQKAPERSEYTYTPQKRGPIDFIKDHSIIFGIVAVIIVIIILTIILGH